jgi:hypothetical protein
MEKGGRRLLVFIPTLRAGATCGDILPRRQFVNPGASKPATGQPSEPVAALNKWTGSMQFLLLEQHIHDKQIWKQLMFPSTICTQEPQVVNMGLIHSCTLAVSRS